MDGFKIVSDQSSVPSLDNGWSKGERGDHLVNSLGLPVTALDKRQYRIIEVHEQELKKIERFGRGIAGVLALILSVGLAWLSADIRNLFARKQRHIYAKEVNPTIESSSVKSIAQSLQLEVNPAAGSPTVKLSTRIPDLKFNAIFKRLSELYGTDRKENKYLKILHEKSWNNSDVQNDIVEFKNCIIEARKKNIALIKEKKLPNLKMDHNMRVSESLGKMVMMLAKLQGDEVIDKAQFDQLSSFMWDIAQRAVVFNTQVHEDSLPLAFNSEVSGIATVDRYRERYAADAPKVAGQPKGYVTRSNCNFFECAKWDPPISPTAPIVQIHRIIGFDTGDGHRSESKVSLDFSFLGSPTVEQRAQLTQFLALCDHSIDQLPEGELGGLPELNKFPEVKEGLKAIDWIPEEKKKLLLKRGMQFAFEVRFELAKNLLNLL